MAASKEQVSLASVRSIVWDSIVVGTEENMKSGIVKSVQPKYQSAARVLTNGVMAMTRNNWPIWNEGHGL